jgi:hypothetical protein
MSTLTPLLVRRAGRAPLGFEGGDTNLYCYVRNSPTNTTDPLGTVPLPESIRENQLREKQKEVDDVLTQWAARDFNDPVLEKKWFDQILKDPDVSAYAMKKFEELKKAAAQKVKEGQECKAAAKKKIEEAEKRLAEAKQKAAEAEQKKKEAEQKRQQLTDAMNLGTYRTKTPAQWVADLDSKQFAIRQEAAEILESVIRLRQDADLKKALEAVLAGKPSLEQRRRIEQLLQGYK